LPYMHVWQRGLSRYYMRLWLPDPSPKPSPDFAVITGVLTRAKVSWI
jgi:hypothetical protein